MPCLSLSAPNLNTMMWIWASPFPPPSLTGIVVGIVVQLLNNPPGYQPYVNRLSQGHWQRQTELEVRKKASILTHS